LRASMAYLKKLSGSENREDKNPEGYYEITWNV
jgi:hypothetical protein